VKAFLYARVSTRDKGQDVENQLAQLREFARRQGWEIIHEYIDHETGSISDRPELQAMLLACSQGKCDVVLFWALDRFTREGAYETLRYLNLLTSYGVGFRSYAEQYLDTCGLFKDAVISILATIAKQERTRISERVKAGMLRAKANGRHVGRPAIGSEKKRTRPALIPSAIATLRAQGMMWSEIAVVLGVGESTVRKFMRRQAEKGSEKADAQVL